MQILASLANAADFRQASLDFLAELGYASPRHFEYSNLSFDEFCDALDVEIKPERVLAPDWKAVHLLFQFTADELGAQNHLFQTRADRELFEAFVFVSLELAGESYNRTQLANMAREINKPFASPVIVLFRHGQTVSLASVARRENRGHGDTHVLQKVSLLKDIRPANPHRAHLEILSDLQKAKSGAHNWTEFLAAWNRVLDLSALNKRFYRELSNWFFAAQEYTTFPDTSDHATERGLIRLITRLIFTWFVKERGLVPAALFDEDQITALLQKSRPEDDTYYRAVLQNLFFATLNSEMGERRFRHANGGAHNQKGDYALSCYFRYENDFKASQQWLDLVKDVPFLNGGLFECLDPEDKDGARIDGFSDNAKRQAHLPNKLFWGDEFIADLSGAYGDTRQRSVKVKPLLNLLHSYKFTIDENTPLEEDVALDPELLGKVFENLLASYNPETRTTARKQTGSFYTPREIVGYMVEEALCAYLEPTADGATTPQDENALRTLLSDTDARKAHELGFSSTRIEALVEAIQRCTILDPACGSGAFPMGALSKMVSLLKKLDPQNNLWRAAQLRAVSEQLKAHSDDEDARQQAEAETKAIFEDNDPDYARKLFLIERCLFGVDIQPVALQIAKLRFFIALIVDQKIDAAKPNFNVRALPNLETKFVCANTLIALPQTGAITPEDLPALETQLAEVRRQHIAPKSRSEKKRLEREDKRLREAIEYSMTEAGFGASFISPIVQWNPYDQNAVAPFFEPQRMFGPELKDGFDIVIGNPPYVRHEGITALKPSLVEYSCYVGTADLYVYFFERALRLLKNGGVLSFICSNKFFRAGYGAKLRAYLLKNSQLQRLIDFGDAPVFTAIAYPHILVTTKTDKPDAQQTFPALSWQIGQPIDEFRSVVESDSFAMPHGSLVGDGWRFEKANTLDLLAKLRENGTPLGEYVGGAIYYGIKTGLNEAFVVDRATRDALIAEDESSTRLLKPFLRGRDVKRWRVNFADYYLIQIESSENKQHAWSSFKKTESDKAEKVFAETHPAIHRHLNQFRAALIKRFDKGRFFWELRACAYWNAFDKAKIVYPDIAIKSEFGYDEGGRLLANTGYIIPTDDKFLLACLNSKVVWHYYLSLTNTIRGGYVRFIYQYVTQLPIPNATPAEQAAISSRVEKILAAKAADSAADVSGLEREIDELVADLYELDEDERKLVGIG